MTDWIDAHRVADLLRPGMTVFVAGSQPTAMGSVPGVGYEPSRLPAR